MDSDREGHITPATKPQCQQRSTPVRAAPATDRSLPRAVWALRAHIAADGHLLRADPWPASRVSGGYARRQRDRAWRGGGHRRGDGADHPRVLRLAVGRARPAQSAHRGRLWPRRHHQAAVPARQLDRPGAARALPRPDRQGDPRRAARCARRRFDAGRSEGRRLRAAPVARHGRRDARSGGGDRLDVSVQRRHPHACSGSP